jgi:hypothetical protein
VYQNAPKPCQPKGGQGFFFADMRFEISDHGLFADMIRIIKLAEVFQNKAIRFIHLKHYF